MKLSDYVELACVTESVVDQIEGLESRMLHGLIGLCTESGELLDAMKKHLYYGKELDTVNMLEEIGDLCWYLAIICDVADIDFAEQIEKAKEFNDTQEERSLLSVCAELNAVCGGNLVTYTNSGQPHVIQPLFYLIDELVIELDGMWEEICEKNIAKLKARYGEKFDAHKALNRDTDAEREILEA
jgi:NTP pyrophosphatase (non-canonical NTP hydrolase)